LIILTRSYIRYKKRRLQVDVYSTLALTTVCPYLLLIKKLMVNKLLLLEGSVVIRKPDIYKYILFYFVNSTKNGDKVWTCRTKLIILYNFPP